MRADYVTEARTAPTRISLINPPSRFIVRQVMTLELAKNRIEILSAEHKDSMKKMKQIKAHITVCRRNVT